jgi:hypothetical protein
MLHASTGTGEHSPYKGTFEALRKRSRIAGSPFLELVEAGLHSYIRRI